MARVTHTERYIGEEGKSAKQILERFSEIKKIALKHGAAEVECWSIGYGEQAGQWLFTQIFNNATEYGAAMDKWGDYWDSPESEEDIKRWSGDRCLHFQSSSATFESVLS
jgi:hypothetical protein